MNKTALLSLIIGLIVGFAVGNLIVSRPQQNVPVSNPIPDPLTKSRPVRPKDFNEQELLLQSIQELDLTTAELEDALNYIEKLERNTHRYNWLTDYWKEEGFDLSNQVSMSFHHQFKPGNNMIEFFGWNEEQVAGITRIGKKVVEEIREWEAQQAVCIEDNENNKVFDIPAMPNEIVERYLNSLEGIIGPDDMEILSSKMESQFNGLLQDRTLTMRIGPNMPGSDAEYMVLRTNPKNADTTLMSIPSNPTIMIPYIPGTTFPHRWDHVIRMEGQPAPIIDVSKEGDNFIEVGSGIVYGSKYVSPE